MRKTIRIILLVCFCAAAYSACQRASEEKKAEEQELEMDSLRLVYTGLSDSLKLRWQILMSEEEQRLQDMRRLLLEISYTPVYNKARYDTLYENLKKVYEMRFEQESMTSEEIDQYDSAASRLKTEIVQFALEHPDIEKYPLMGELIEDIEAADQQILFHRVQYDNYVRDYNHFLYGNREYLPKIDTANIPEEMPMFQISE